jgi:hypothetical protein
MNDQDTYVRNIFEALFLTAKIHVDYDAGDEMWHVLVDRPTRTVGGTTYPAVSYHFAMQVTSDDDVYCFTEADDLIEPISFPIITDDIFAIWENDDSPVTPRYTEPSSHGL